MFIIEARANFEDGSTQRAGWICKGSVWPRWSQAKAERFKTRRAARAECRAIARKHAMGILTLHVRAA